MQKEEKVLGSQRRIKLTPQQIKSLNKFYNCNSKPGNKDRIKIAEALGIEIERIKNWFQNRRAKDKKESIESTEHLVLSNTHEKPSFEKTQEPEISQNTDHVLLSINTCEKTTQINTQEKKGMFKIRPNCNDLYTRRDL